MITITSETQQVLSPSVDRDGVWRSKPTGQTVTVYVVTVDGVRDTVHTTLRDAQTAAQERAFVAGLVVGDAAAWQALAVWSFGEDGYWFLRPEAR
jgi:hypothetical protein